MQGTYTEKIKRLKPSDFARHDPKRDKTKDKRKRYVKERERKRENYD